METIREMTLSDAEYNALNAQSANYRSILRLLIASGLNTYLKTDGKAPIDLVTNPADITGGESCMLFLKALADEAARLSQTNTLLKKEKEMRKSGKSVPIKDPEIPKSGIIFTSADQRRRFLQGLLIAFIVFVFISWAFFLSHG